jgi:hypothetical protein
MLRAREPPSDKAESGMCARLPVSNEPISEAVDSGRHGRRTPKETVRIGITCITGISAGTKILGPRIESPRTPPTRSLPRSPPSPCSALVFLRSSLSGSLLPPQPRLAILPPSSPPRRLPSTRLPCCSSASTERSPGWQSLAMNTSNSLRRTTRCFKTRGLSSASTAVASTGTTTSLAVVWLRC